jgi:hypothetical protein
MPVLSSQRNEAVALAYISDPEKVGWRPYKSVYRNSSQHAASVAFSRLLKKANFQARVGELQGAASTNAEITLETLLRLSLIRDVDGVHHSILPPTVRTTAVQIDQPQHDPDGQNDFDKQSALDREKGGPVLSRRYETIAFQIGPIRMHCAQRFAVGIVVGCAPAQQ